MLGLRRLKLNAIWLEIFPGTGNEIADRRAIRSFKTQLRRHGLAENYCLLYQPRASDAHELGGMRCLGMSESDLRSRLAGPNALLNLSYSVHPPLLLQFERRIFCDLDPSEIFYWMTKMEMGQSYHHEFWTIGLNAGAHDCRLPQSHVAWRKFFPLVDTELIQPQAAPARFKLTTIGQWYWGGAVEVNGQFPDLSKKVAFEKYLELPARVKKARFELAMNISERRSGASTLERKWLARARSSSRGKNAGALSALRGIGQRRVHSDQRRRCGLANRLAERSRRDIPGDGASGCYRRHWRVKIFAAEKWISFRA